MKASIILRTWTAVAIAASCASIQAVETNLPSQFSQQGGISYLSGGIGQEEVDAIRADAGNFNLKMMFTSVSGEFLADVKVTLADSKGNVVLETVSEGPCLFAKVPPGHYKVSAATLNKEYTKPVELTAKHGAKVHFSWALPRQPFDQEFSDLDERSKGQTRRGCF
jgi:hypothetical protein